MSDKHLTDLEIAKQAEKKNILDIGLKAGFSKDDIFPYGNFKAKIKSWC